MMVSFSPSGVKMVTDFSNSFATILDFDDKQAGFDSLDQGDSGESVHTVCSIKETFFSLISKGKPLEKPQIRSCHRTAHDFNRS